MLIDVNYMSLYIYKLNIFFYIVIHILHIVFWILLRYDLGNFFVRCQIICKVLAAVECLM